jgi:hypothetical protein
VSFRTVVLLSLLPALAFAVPPDRPGASLLHEDAVRGYILSYARARPATTAKEDFTELLKGVFVLDGPSPVRKALTQLAAAYEDIGRFRDAALLYRQLSDDAPLAPDSMVFEANLLRLTANEGNRPHTVEQALRFQKRFRVEMAFLGDGPQPREVATARDEAERELSALVVAWHRERPDFDVERATRATDTLYSIYLELFPTGEKSYQLRFFRAELAYGQLHDYRLAAELYTQVFDEDIAAAKPGRFMELAAYNAILAWDELAKSGG